MNCRFHPAAEAKFSDAVQFYEEVEPRLAQDFAVEALSAVQRAVAYPRASAVLQGEVRRSLVRRFPYGVLYSIDGEEILIMAVMHLRREPDYWTKRA